MKTELQKKEAQVKRLEKQIKFLKSKKISPATLQRYVAPKLEEIRLLKMEMDVINRAAIIHYATMYNDIKNGGMDDVNRMRNLKVTKRPPNYSADQDRSKKWW